ncbi:hypothetical protein [Granulicella aggregans]|nr:hypothetical protein [Granulicella aggregans]
MQNVDVVSLTQCSGVSVEMSHSHDVYSGCGSVWFLPKRVYN